VEHYGQPFMAFGTRRALGQSRDQRTRRYTQELSAMNSTRGTARAFSRTVRDVIAFGGQTRHFLHRAREVKAFPPIAVLWGERDTLIPMAHGQRFVESVNGATFEFFPNCGHYLHQEQPEAFVATVKAFLDAEDAPHVTLKDAPARRARSGSVRRVLDEVARIARSRSRREPARGQDHPR
jgi:pimeloyl-ACP methyl ester carboxylesterase